MRDEKGVCLIRIERVSFVINLNSTPQFSCMVCIDLILFSVRGLSSVQKA